MQVSPKAGGMTVATVLDVHLTTEHGLSKHGGSSEMGTQAQVEHSPAWTAGMIVGVVVAMQKRSWQGFAGHVGCFTMRH